MKKIYPVFLLLWFLAALSPLYAKSSNYSSVMLEVSHSQINDDLEKSSEKLFSESRKMFEQGNYWDCARNLILLLDIYPNYTCIDQVVYMLGDCLYETGLLEGAKKMYTFFITKFISSPLLPSGLTGLQRIAFDEGDYEKSIELYKAIIKCSPGQNILDYASYYAGLSCYYSGQSQKAVEILSSLTPLSVYYDSGLYLKGLSLLKMEQLREGIDVFNQICKLPCYTVSRKNIINESHLTLAYLYYELGYYQYALKQFSAVSREHEQYDKVLLSAGWAATKTENYKQAILFLTDFISSYDETENTPEGLFLIGQCYIKLGLYQEALNSYEYLIELLPRNELLPEMLGGISDYLTIQLSEIEKKKMDLLVLESKFVHNLEVDPKSDVPDYVIKESHHVNEQRSELLTRLQDEKTQLNQLSDKIKTVRNLTVTKEQQKSWRAFAEYGKSRAMFLYKQQNEN